MVSGMPLWPGSKASLPSSPWMIWKKGSGRHHSAISLVSDCRPCQCEQRAADHDLNELAISDCNSQAPTQ